MAKRTTEQRREQQAEQERLYLESTAVYRATIPARLMAAQALASSVGLRSSVTLTEVGPSVRFYDQYTDDGFCEPATYQMEEWELEYLEQRLQERKAAQDAKALRRKLAETAWGTKLTQEEKVAIKEFIPYLS